MTKTSSVWGIVGIGFLIILLGGIIVGGAYFILTALETDGDITITGFFDSNRKLVTEDAQAVVQGVPNIQYITMDIRASNIGDIPLTFVILDASPAEFKAVVPIGEEIVAAAGQDGVWETELMDVEPLVGGQTTLSAIIQATSAGGEVETKTATAILTVMPDEQLELQWEVGIDPGESTEFGGGGGGGGGGGQGGGGGGGGSFANFRTSDTDYGSHSAIAYTTSCGSTLTAYGDKGTTTWKCGDGGTLTESSVPGGTLCERKNYPTRLFILTDTGTSRYYETNDPDATAVSTSSSRINPNNEVSC